MEKGLDKSSAGWHTGGGCLIMGVVNARLPKCELTQTFLLFWRSLRILKTSVTTTSVSFMMSSFCDKSSINSNRKLFKIHIM